MHQLFPNPSRHISVFIWSGIHTVFAFLRKKQLASQFIFTYRYIDDILSINNPNFDNYFGQMYPSEVKIKDTMESNISDSDFDLLLSSRRDRCAFTFTTHVMIITSISQIFFSWVAIFNLRQPMVWFIELIRYSRTSSSYECFIVRAARLSCKLHGQGYAIERWKSSLMKFYGRYGDPIKHYEIFLTHMLHNILGHDHIQWHPPSISHFTKSWPCYPTWPHCRSWCYYLIAGGFHMIFATGAARWQRKLTPPDIWSCFVPFGTPTDHPKSVRNRCVIEFFIYVFCVVNLPFDISICVGAFVIGLSQISSFFFFCMCSNVEIILFWTCHVCGPFKFRTSLGTSILLSQTKWFKNFERWCPKSA